MKYKNRAEAGHRLAEVLIKYKNQKNTVVVGLPRGGVTVGVALANDLNLPLDFLFVERITHPSHPEYSIAALTEKGEIVLNKMEAKNFDQNWLVSELGKLRKQMSERRKLYLGNIKPTHFKNKVVIVVDDGMATGLTMKAAVQCIAKSHPLKIIIATPVAAYEAVEELAQYADEVISLYTAYHFDAVSNYYQDFSHYNYHHDMARKPKLST